MPRIGEIQSLDKLLPHSLLKKSWLWQRPVEEVRPEELVAFLRLQRVEGRLTEARRNIDSLLHATFQAMLSGQVVEAPYAAFSEPGPAFTVADLCDMLEPLSVVRKRAVIVALETGLFPRDVMLMSWQSPKRAQLPPLAAAMVTAQPRHFKLNYIFWEYLDEGVAAPLFGLAEELNTVTSLEFSALLDLYRGMRWVDIEAEADDLRRNLALMH